MVWSQFLEPWAEDACLRIKGGKGGRMRRCAIPSKSSFESNVNCANEKKPVMKSRVTGLILVLLFEVIKGVVTTLDPFSWALQGGVFFSRSEFSYE